MLLYMALFVIWWMYYIYENRRRDRIVAQRNLSQKEQEYERLRAGESDMTDMEVSTVYGTRGLTSSRISTSATSAKNLCIYVSGMNEVESSSDEDCTPSLQRKIIIINNTKKSTKLKTIVLSTNDKRVNRVVTTSPTLSTRRDKRVE
jgi:hypothetical protein